MTSPITCVILAGRRANGDRVEQETGRHKAFLEFDGTCMIDRVLGALGAIERIKRTWIFAPDDLHGDLSSRNVAGTAIEMLPAQSLSLIHISEPTRPY